MPRQHDPKMNHVMSIFENTRNIKIAADNIENHFLALRFQSGPAMLEWKRAIQDLVSTIEHLTPTLVSDTADWRVNARNRHERRKAAKLNK